MTGKVRIHDHITWCVVAVLEGTEHEEVFDEALNPMGARTTTRVTSAASHRPATSTASETSGARPPSACTSTALTSPGSAPAAAATTANPQDSGLLAFRRSKPPI